MGPLFMSRVIAWSRVDLIQRNIHNLSPDLVGIAAEVQCGCLHSLPVRPSHEKATGT